MDRLVHQRAAAIERRGSLPAPDAVISIIPPPRHVRGDERQAAEATGRRRRADGLDNRVEALREDRAQRDPRLGGDRPHGVDPPKRDFERLFADHVDAPPGGGLQALQMGTGRGGDRDEVRLLAAQHRGGIGVPPAAELLRERAPLRLGATAPGDKFDAVDVCQRPGMHPRDRTDADDRGPHSVPPRVEPGGAASPQHQGPQRAQCGPPETAEQACRRRRRATTSEAGPITSPGRRRRRADR